MKYTDVFEWLALIINIGDVDLLQRIEALHDSAEDSSFAVEVINILSQSDNELASREPLIWIILGRGSGHAHGAHGFVLQFWVKLWLERFLGGVLGIQNAPY